EARRLRSTRKNGTLDEPQRVGLCITRPRSIQKTKNRRECFIGTGDASSLHEIVNTGANDERSRYARASREGGGASRARREAPSRSGKKFQGGRPREVCASFTRGARSCAACARASR